MERIDSLEEKLRERQETAVDWQNQFNRLWSQCNEKGYSVLYDNKGHPILVKKEITNKG